MPARFIFTVGLLLTFTFAVTAQVPKDKPPVRIKYTPQQIAEAEKELRKMGCALHHEGDDPPDDDFMMRPVVAADKRGPVDIVACPDTTTDAELGKMVPFMRRLPGLKTLDLAQNTVLTAKGFKHLAPLIDLQGLMLDATSINNDGLRELAPLTSLHWLDLSRTAITDAGIPLLARIERLQTLLLKDVRGLSSDGVASLSNIKRLRVLHITVERETFAKVQNIAQLNLTELGIHPISDAETAELAKLSNLQVLEVGNVNLVSRRLNDRVRAAGGNNRITDKGLNTLSACSQLRVLKLSGNPVSLRGAKDLIALKNLEEIDLSGTDVEDEGVEVLGQLRTLRVLDLSHTMVKEPGLRELADLPGIERLFLMGLHIGDTALRDLCRLRSLKELDLSSTRVTCQNISDLMLLAQLQRLRLRSTNVTDSSLPSLSRLKSLKTLDLRDNCPNITTRGVQPLQQELPKCWIRYYATCTFTGWPGAIGYAFKLPAFQNSPLPMTIKTNPTVPVNIPAGPPPKVTPNIRVPTAGNGTAPPKP